MYWENSLMNLSTMIGKVESRAVNRPIRIYMRRSIGLTINPIAEPVAIVSAKIAITFKNDALADINPCNG